MVRGAAPRLVGRRAELDRFRACLDAARTGTHSLTLIRAPAGMGKSALADDVARRAHDAGVAVASGTCWDGPVRPPLFPWLAVDRALDVGVLGGADHGDERDQLARFDAFADAIERRTRSGPVVIVLDDLHWADQTSLDLLRFLVRHLRATPFVVWASYRPTDEDLATRRQLDRLERDGEVIDLPPLDADELGDLLDGVSSERVARIHEATAGHPFFALELARELATGGDREVLSSLPRGVLSLIDEQLDRLGPHRRIVEIAAVADHAPDASVVARVAGVDPAAVHEATRHAADLGLMTHVADRARFVHALATEAIRHGLDAADRRTLHLRLAEALAADPDPATDDPDLVLGHLLAGDAEPDRIRQAAVDAADRARARTAWAEQVRHLATAVDAGPDDVGLLVRLARAQVAANDHDAARATCERGAALARAGGDVVGLAEIALVAPPPHGSVELAEWRNPDQSALRREALDALSRLPGTDDRLAALQARLMGALAVARYWDEDTGVRATDHAATLDERDQLTTKAVAIARDADDPALLADALSARISAMWGPDGDDERPAIADELIRVARETGQLHHEFTGRMIRIMHLLRVGRFAEASAAIDVFDNDAASAHLRRHRWTATRWRSVLAMVHGRVDDTVRLAREACEIGLPAVGDTAREFRAAGLGWAMYFRRDLAAIGENAVALARATPHVPAWWIGAGWYGSEGGPVEQAREALTRLSTDGFRHVPRDVNWITTLTNMASVAFWVGDHDAATAIARQLAPYRGQRAVLGVGYAYYGPISRALALAHATAGDAVAAVELFHEAIRQSEPTGDPYGPLAHLEFAVAASRDPDAFAGVVPGEHFDAAADGFTALGLDAFAERVRDVRTDVRPSAATLREDGRDWVVETDGEIARLGRLKGFPALRELLRRPHHHLHALDLHAATSGGGPTPDAAIETLDRRAVTDFRRRLDVLDAELDAADARGDVALSERLAAERDAIEDELRRSMGLGGRTASLTSDTERARVMLTKQLARAIDRIDEHAPAVGRHLRDSVETGTYFVYRPLTDSMRWDLG